MNQTVGLLSESYSQKNLFVHKFAAHKLNFHHIILNFEFKIWYHNLTRQIYTDSR